MWRNMRSVGTSSPHTPAGTWSARNSFGRSASAVRMISRLRSSRAASTETCRRRGRQSFVPTLTIDGSFMKSTPGGIVIRSADGLPTSISTLAPGTSRTKRDAMLRLRRMWPRPKPSCEYISTVGAVLPSTRAVPRAAGIDPRASGCPSSATMRARISLSENGLHRNAAAPSVAARLRLAFESSPLITTTGSSGSDPRTSASRSRPSPSGRFRSRHIASKCSPSSSPRAVSESGAACAMNPALRR